MQQWNKIFKREGKVFIKVHENIPEMGRLFKKRGVKKILDLGCGSGRHIVYFAKKGFDVYGIDIAKEGLNITKSSLKKENLKANLKIGNIYNKLPYPDRFFDAIVCVQVLHHAKVGKIRKSIKEIERILGPKGLLFLTVKRSKYKATARRYNTIAPRTYIPLDGREKGLTHYIYNEELLRKDFKNFKINKIGVDSRNHYCFIGEKM